MPYTIRQKYNFSLSITLDSDCVLRYTLNANMFIAFEKK